MSRRKFGLPNSKFGFGILMVISLFAATGCGSASAAFDEDDGRPKVVTTFTVLADIAQNVGGELIHVESLTKAGVEIHGYEPTPSDVRRVDGADLVLENGLGLETWFDGFMGRIDAARVTVSDGVETIPIAAGDYAGEANPHAWMSPLNVVVYAENIAAAFAELDPPNADRFEQNAAEYSEKLRDVHTELVDGVGTLPARKRALVTCEGAFSYLARDAGLAEAYLWPVNSDEQGTPRQVTDVIAFLRDNAIPAVFCESTVSDRLQRQVAAEAGTEFGGVLYVDSLSEPGGPVPTYLDLIRHDVETIVAGLVGPDAVEPGAAESDGGDL